MLQLNILFMCVANSARSQMAEGLARKVFGPSAHIESAGSQPSKVNEFAIQVMQEIGIDISKHHSKFYDDLSPSFLASVNYVITLCAEEVCPVVVSKGKRLCWPMPDPAKKDEGAEAQLRRFRQTRDALKLKLEEFHSSLQ